MSGGRRLYAIVHRTFQAVWMNARGSNTRASTPADPPESTAGGVEEGMDALLMDGRIVHVRPVSEGDMEALTALYNRASPRSRYLRFFTGGVSIEREVERLVMPEDDHRGTGC